MSNPNYLPAKFTAEESAKLEQLRQLIVLRRPTPAQAAQLAREVARQYHVPVALVRQLLVVGGAACRPAK